MRYDHSGSSFLDQHVGPEKFIPAALTYPAQDGVTGYNDLTPRLGASYDVFANGKTAVKVTAGKYADAASHNCVYATSFGGIVQEGCPHPFGKDYGRRPMEQAGRQFVSLWTSSPTNMLRPLAREAHSRHHVRISRMRAKRVEAREVEQDRHG